jgi:hypothetical protein
MNAYYKETKKPFGYLLVDNKPDTPADKQVLGDLFGDCRVYLFATQTKVNNTSVKPTPVETKPRRKQPKHQRHTRKYVHAETLALLTKPLHFPNMKYLK